MARTLIRHRIGFTLIELLIVIAVIAILATVAFPAYQDQIRKARRTDGQIALVGIAMAQERFRGNCSRYALTLNVASGMVCDDPVYSLPLARKSPEGWYDLTLSDANAAGFAATATALDAQAMDRAGGVDCKVLTIDQEGAKTPRECWR
ncbi:MAG: prepilin-type N-terminal cleavage/methylation domain-containing protein [Thiocapsa sp.]|uniref:type IV pilin protein n=1 Tax=Thiocapsa sp. TaxID=2024551 RepID=UPI001BCD8E06|nr:type IV pilin protein [Thiocapsa sp.]QVL49044.1 MAG: prepilin-type N-terminal cleavage/methylation domain-containing protein [Thiocapsa sp.]